MLPKPFLPTDEVEISDGTRLTVRGLSRGEYLSVGKDAGGDPIEAEIRALALGTDTALDEAREWYSGALAGDVGLLLDKITELSGMGPKAKKS